MSDEFLNESHRASEILFLVFDQHFEKNSASLIACGSDAA